MFIINIVHNPKYHREFLNWILILLDYSYVSASKRLPIFLRCLVPSPSGPENKGGTLRNVHNITSRHGITSQKTRMFISTTLTTSTVVFNISLSDLSTWCNVSKRRKAFLRCYFVCIRHQRLCVSVIKGRSCRAEAILMAVAQFILNLESASFVRYQHSVCIWSHLNDVLHAVQNYRIYFVIWISCIFLYSEDVRPQFRLFLLSIFL
jgi:hypothetical protein